MIFAPPLKKSGTYKWQPTIKPYLTSNRFCFVLLCIVCPQPYGGRVEQISFKNVIKAKQYRKKNNEATNLQKHQFLIDNAFCHISTIVQFIFCDTFILYSYNMLGAFIHKKIIETIHLSSKSRHSSPVYFCCNRVGESEGNQIRDIKENY